MSGHSKWSTIKRKKGAEDAKRGQLFSKLSRAITIAAKQGGGDPGANLRLKLAIEQARTSNMPKENIDRALRSAQSKLAGGLEEVTYEGFGPSGIAVLVETATDNKNRTAQEIKNIFERAGGSLAGRGSVSFQFEQKGLILVEKATPSGGPGTGEQEVMLTLIDLGAQDVEETDDGIEVYTDSSNLFSLKDKIEERGLKVKSAELTFNPKSYVEISEKNKAQKVLSFLETLDGLEDVQRVFANFDAPEELVN